MGWYLVITEEMRALGLKGNELIVFAAIYGFSQKGAGCYYGGQPLLAEICGVTDRTLREVLTRLEEKGLLKKQTITRNGREFCSYSTPEEISAHPGKNFRLPRKKFPPYNKDNISTISKDIDATLSNTRARFIAPTLEEVKAYIDAKGSSVDAEAFHAFYTSNGWKIGKAPMKDWHAAITTWERRQRDEKPRKSPTPTPPQSDDNYVLHNLRVLDKLQGTHRVEEYLAQKQRRNIDEQ